MQHKKEEFFEKIIVFINNYYERNGIPPTNREISKETELSTATVSRYINKMKEDGILEFEGHRGVITKQVKNRSNNSIPIVGRIACGTPTIAEEFIEDYVYLPISLIDKGKYFFLRASGDSMVNIGISSGDLVLIREQNTAQNGDIVVALIDSEVTLKRFYREEGRIRLHPENDRMHDIYVDTCIIQGIAVKILKDIH